LRKFKLFDRSKQTYFVN